MGGGFVQPQFDAGTVQDTAKVQDVAGTADGGADAISDTAQSTEDAADILETSTPPKGNSWTFLIYLVADNNLEAAAVEDLKEMMQVGAAAGFTMLVQIDRAETQGGGYSSDDVGGLADFTGAKRLRIEKGKLVELDDMGELDRTKPDTLADFIEWGVATAPADRIALILWDHGAGVWGYGNDDSVGGKAATLPQVRQGIESGLLKAGIERLDLLGFDACLMATWEVGAAMRPFARYMLASEETEPAHGWDYRRFKLVRDMPSLDPTAVGKIIADGFLDQGKEQEQAERITLSLVDLDKMPAVEVAVAKLAALMGQSSGPVTVPLARALPGTLKFGDNLDPDHAYHHLDLGTTGQLALSKASPEAAGVGAELKAALGAAVLYKVAGPTMADASGLAIYFPPTQAIYDKKGPEYDEIPEAAKWATGLQSFYTSAKALGKLVKQSGAPTLKWQDSEVQISGQLAPEAIPAWVDAVAMLGVQTSGGAVDVVRQGPAIVTGAAIEAKVKAQYLGFQSPGGQPAPAYVNMRDYATASGKRREIRIPVRLSGPGYEPENINVLRYILDGSGVVLSGTMIDVSSSGVNEVPLDNLKGDPRPFVPLIRRYTNGVASFVATSQTPLDLATAQMVTVPLPTGVKLVAGLQVTGPDGSTDVKWSSPAALTAKCGDGLCAATETKVSCAADCGPLTVCGNGKCEIGEDADGCPDDCEPAGPECGDDQCDPPESSKTCPFDCQAAGWICGDGTCNADETTWSCAEDCAPKSVCGDGNCTGVETEANCPKDCGSPASCGDFACTAGETEDACPFDCEPEFKCVFSKCLAQAKGCYADSGCAAYLQCVNWCGADDTCAQTCAQNASTSALAAIQPLVDCAGASGCLGSGPMCGNGTCEAGETSANCASDCAGSSASCKGICGKQAPAGCFCDDQCMQNGDCCSDKALVCSGSGPTCGNGTCEAGETAASCPADCAGSSASCKGICGKQAPAGCFCDDQCMQNGDCCSDKALVCGGASGPTCGNGLCEAGESSTSCASDCPASSSTCKGYCGGKSAGACYCDDQCAQNGDCCPDKVPVCGAGAGGAGCAGLCGQQSKEANGTVCYCDSQCVQNGDCCANYSQVCP
jgi:hypothetical protein